MKKNLIIILLIFIIPVCGYFLLSKAGNSANVAEAVTSKPQIVKFTSEMCLDCQEMNKVIREIYPQYRDKIVLVEIPVQDGKEFTQQQIKKYDVSLVPTIILVDSAGKQVKRIEGAIPKEEMKKYLDGLK